MALIATEGFDHYSSIADAALRTGALRNFALGNGNSIVSPGRGGYGKCWGMVDQGAQYSSLTVVSSTNLATGYFGGGFRVASGGLGMMMMLVDPVAANAGQVSLNFLAASGVITLYSGSNLYGGGTAIAASATNAINLSNWNFVEVGAKIAATGGFVIVQVNGTQVLNWSGNTQTTANASFGGVLMGPSPGSGQPASNVQIDDFRINDTTTGPGSFPCNGFLGDLRVATLFPAANSAVSWTPLANTNWQEVSETAFDGDTSYNSSAVVGNADLFTVAPVPTGSTIIGVSVIGAYRNEDASAHTLAQQISAGGTIHAGAVQSLTQVYQFLSDVFPINPTSGVSWTVADVNAMLIGYAVTS